MFTLGDILVQEQSANPLLKLKKPIMQAQCEFCGEWFRQTRKGHRHCSTKCQQDNKYLKRRATRNQS